MIIFLHGLLGNSKNLRTPAKRLTSALPDYAALLLDLRGHGNSNNGNSHADHRRPHDFANCVEDVYETLLPMGLVGRDSPYAICGHSLGGRIALEYAHAIYRTTSVDATRVNEEDEDSTRLRMPKQTWILDSVPGIADKSVHGVLRAISSLSMDGTTTIPSRKCVVDALTSEPHGLDLSLARWIATNLRDARSGTGGGGGRSSSPSHLEWAFDLDVANELIRNFADQDFVRMIRDVTSGSSASASASSSPRSDDDEDAIPSTDVHLVMAGRNESWTDDIVSELESIPSFIPESSSPLAPSPSSSFRMHKLDKAGHWVHVDDLDGLLTLMIDGLRRHQ